MSLVVLFGLFFGGVVIGMPVAFALGVAGFGAILYEGFPLSLAFQRIVAGVGVHSLVAIPFFIFAGELMNHGGIAKHLVRLASSAVGWVRGGLGLVNVFASMLFGGISGSAVADISALGSILMPVMKEKGYDDDYAVNVTVTSSLAGIVIPPSHNMILYAVAAGAGSGISVASLFMAGVIPGILMCLCLAAAAYIVAIKRGYGKEPFPGLVALAVHFAYALPGLFTAVIIVGGVLSGVFTVTESGAFGALYAAAVTAILYRRLTWENFKKAVVGAVRTTSMVMILIACASVFAYMLTINRVPSLMVDALVGISNDPIMILLMINLILLLLGMIMDMAALILICTPIFLPVVTAIDMDPLQFGIVLMMNLGLGLCTPPVGACLFVGCSIGKVPIERAVKTIWPFYIAILVALMLTTFVPELTLTIPEWIKESPD